MPLTAESCFYLQAPEPLHLPLQQIASDAHGEPEPAQHTPALLHAPVQQAAEPLPMHGFPPAQLAPIDRHEYSGQHVPEPQKPLQHCESLVHAEPSEVQGDSHTPLMQDKLQQSVLTTHGEPVKQQPSVHGR